MIGSINSDITIAADTLVKPNETIVGHADYILSQGGKGANQAVAAAAAGATVAMVACVGDDSFGESAIADLKKSGVDCSHVRTIAGASTGMAAVLVDSAGNNMITVAPGANGRLGVADIRAAEPLIRASSILLLQLEVPLAAVEEAARIARAAGVRVILNPAPAPASLPDWLDQVDILIPNQHEATALAGRGAGASAEATAQHLLEAGAGAVVITLGGDGCLLAQAERRQYVAPYAVDAVDTTGAGDTFCGFLAAGLAAGDAIGDAVETANAAAAISVTRPRARESVPSAADVARFRDQHRRQPPAAIRRARP
ncbi:ribokinase [Sphingomonas flavalba]|uniref:ribokinase n=1 Tax=Sphingomonas flavalba TaxID=2559804 RepID=UPI0039E04769